jgi:hypothetical protein
VPAAQALNCDTLHAAYVGIFCGLTTGIEVLSHAFIGWMPKLPRFSARNSTSTNTRGLNQVAFGFLTLRVRMVVRKADILLDAKPDDASYRWSTNVMRRLASMGAALF